MTATSGALLLGVIGLAAVAIGLPFVVVRTRRVTALGGGVPPGLLVLALGLGVLAVLSVTGIVVAVVLR
jgi:hypothetical protein